MTAPPRPAQMPETGPLDRAALDELLGRVAPAGGVPGTAPRPAGAACWIAAAGAPDPGVETTDLPIGVLTAPWQTIDPPAARTAPMPPIETVSAPSPVDATPYVPWFAVPAPARHPGAAPRSAPGPGVPRRPPPVAGPPPPGARRPHQLDELYASLWTRPPVLPVAAAPVVLPGTPRPSSAAVEPGPEPVETPAARRSRFRLGFRPRPRLRLRLRLRTVVGVGGLGCTVAAAVVMAASLWQTAADLDAVPGAIGDPVRAAVTGVVPQRIVIPGRGVVAPVVAVRTGTGGVPAMPERPTAVGWWSPGARPGGSTGTAVLAGHVDARVAGSGGLAVLHGLQVGERIDVAGTDGRTVTFTVVARRAFATAPLPVDDLRGTLTGPPRLVLITAAGAFDAGTGGYEDTVVVYATPSS